MKIGYRQWHELLCIFFLRSYAMLQLYSIMLYMNMICFPIFYSHICQVASNDHIYVSIVTSFLCNAIHVKLCNLSQFFFFHLQVRDLVEKCTCPSQFPMIRVSEGKYRIGDTKVLIFVRVSTINLWVMRESSSQHKNCITF